MAMCLRSTKLAWDDLTAASERISCSIPHSAPAAGGGQAATAATSNARRAPLAPVVIEIEPVIRCPPAIVLEPSDVALQRLLHRTAPFGALRPSRPGEPLEVHVVAPAAAVKPEHQQDRPAQRRGETERPRRKARRRPEKRNRQRAVARQRAVGEHADT